MGMFYFCLIIRTLFGYHGARLIARSPAAGQLWLVVDRLCSVEAARSDTLHDLAVA